MDKLEEIVRVRNELLKGQEQTSDEMEKLAFLISQKIKTAFIGALASFENHFGELWGHNKIKLSEEEKRVRDIWSKTRKEVLDKGNEQIKKMRADLSNFDISEAVYNYTFSNEGDGINVR